MRQTPATLLSAATVAGALIAGGRHGPQDPGTAVWYASLRKPAFTPPGPAIGAAWMVLGGLLTYAGQRLLRAPGSDARSGALAAWAVSVAGVVGFPWAFFGRHALGGSTAMAGGMLASAATTCLAARRVDRKAAAAVVPLVGWVGFALLLSEELWRRNPRHRRGL